MKLKFSKARLHLSNVQGDNAYIVDGLNCGHFGIHQEGNQWVVSHLVTGKRLGACSYLADAKRKAQAFSEFPLNWDDKNLQRTISGLTQEVRNRLIVIARAWSHPIQEVSA